MTYQNVTFSVRWGVCKAVFWFYHNAISPFFAPCCRFQPTCSVYAREAVLHFGFLKGTLLALRRILRCHPFYRGCLFDPVPENPRLSNLPGTHKKKDKKHG